jgi:hypothetical protein
MIDVTCALRSRLVSAQAHYAKASDLINDPELVRHYADTARRFEHLCAGIERIPPATVRLTEQLAAIAGRARFDASLAACVDDVGRRSFPYSAAELLGVVNLSLRFAEFRFAGD